ncbi:hypothetical protein BT96DRAFT_534454 [Gymnopus androsaceus JB14]|uniref:Uncharacterized protein n=1 Tax=Gymnopus androsaceus JB14 TaxID=1447944 RepID=A0A6A4ILN6_9AGAR|nr:hypothetical protein BT96DRAFT_534454 [Gymnopus androsaceus JB14]
MHEIQKRQAKKTSMLSAAFDNQKKALYASARKQAKEMSREGVAYLENLKSTLLDMRKDEVPFKSYLNEVTPLWQNREAPLSTLYDNYQSDMNDLFVRRSQATNDASGMIRANPERREKSLRQHMANARKELDRCHEKEIESTDASKLVKHYKALLHTA